MGHPNGLNRVLEPKPALLRVFSAAIGATLSLLPIVPVANAALQIGWESPTEPGVKVLQTYELGALGVRKLVTLTERDPFAKDPKALAKFQGLSLSALMTEATKTLSAADRSNTDLVVFKTKEGKETLLPKAFLAKYPDILLALKKNGQDLGVESPRIILPATTNQGIRKEHVLLEPIFLSSVASITLMSYEARYGAFFLEHRMDPSAVRGEKIYLQNCVNCHSQPEVTLAKMTGGEKAGEKAAQILAGDHPEVPGVPGLREEFKALFDKKMSRSLASYLEAFKKQPVTEKKSSSWFGN